MSDMPEKKTLSMSISCPSCTEKLDRIAELEAREQRIKDSMNELAVENGPLKAQQQRLVESLQLYLAEAVEAGTLSEGSYWHDRLKNLASMEKDDGS